MDYIDSIQHGINIDTGASQTDSFALRSQVGFDLPQPNPQVTSYVIEIPQLAHTKIALFKEIWEKLDNLPILNQQS